MPHDRNGELLQKGDKVLIPCVVTDVSESEDYCNITVETEEPCHPGDSKSSYTLNARQVCKECEPEDND